MAEIQTPAPMKLIFEDQGQDCLYFVVQGERIVKAGPFQNWLWAGKRLERANYRPGEHVVFDDGRSYNYPVERIEPMQPGWEAPACR